MSEIYIGLRHVPASKHICLETVVPKHRCALENFQTRDSSSGTSTLCIALLVTQSFLNSSRKALRTAFPSGGKKHSNIDLNTYQVPGITGDPSK